MMNLKQQVILASNSQRRQDLLKSVGIDFIVKSKNTDESYPATLNVNEVAKYIAKKKALAFKEEINDEILITADTVVINDSQILGKPNSEKEAFQMLKALNNGVHEVTTAVCILTKKEMHLFDDTTQVHFGELTDEEITFYIKKYQPFDKAGAYGIQEWIGMVAIHKIVGCYFTVVGLPVHKLFNYLKTISHEVG